MSAGADAPRKSQTHIGWLNALAVRIDFDDHLDDRGLLHLERKSWLGFCVGRAVPLDMLDLAKADRRRRIPLSRFLNAGNVKRRRPVLSLGAVKLLLRLFRIKRQPFFRLVERKKK